MPKHVYVINRGGHNYQPAEKFGELVFMTEGRYEKFATGEMFRDFEEHLKSSSPDDYILLGGPTTMCSMASAMFAALHGCINWLIYDAVKGGYCVRNISFANVPHSNLTDMGSSRQ